MNQGFGLALHGSTLGQEAAVNQHYRWYLSMKNLPFGTDLPRIVHAGLVYSGLSSDYNSLCPVVLFHDF
jgi:hypothetical protein